MAVNLTGIAHVRHDVCVNGCTCFAKCGDELSCPYCGEARYRRVSDRDVLRRPPIASRHSIVYCPECEPPEGTKPEVVLHKMWRGQGGVERVVQTTLNDMARATLGVLPSTPTAFLQASGGILGARACLDRRQAAFAARCAATGGKRGTVVVGGTGSMAGRLRVSLGVKKEELGWVEEDGSGEGRTFPGEIHLPATVEEEQERMAAKERAIEEAEKIMKEGAEIVWTDGSRLEGGRGAGAAYCYLENTETTDGRIRHGRRATWRAESQAQRHRQRWTYGGREISTRESTGPGYRGGSIHMGSRAEAFDAEIMAVAALRHLTGRGGRDRRCVVFTNSTAVMRRLQDDRPGAGRELACEAMDWVGDLAETGCRVEIRWIPGHSGVEGNEMADNMAREAAERGMAGEKEKGIARRISLAYLSRRRSEEASRRWKTDTTDRMRNGAGNKRRGAFRRPGRGPVLRAELKGVSKGVASRFHQLWSGHAMIAPFLKDKWGWIEEDTCWFCRRGRQTRGHQFKEWMRWKEEIREMWRKVGAESGKGEGGKARARPDNTRVAELLGNERYTRAVLDFLEETEVGCVGGGVRVGPRVLGAGGTGAT